MKLRNIIESEESLKELMSTKVPINTAVKISKIQIELNIVLDVFTKNKKDMFKKYGSESQGSITIKDEYISTFSKEIDSLLNEDIDISIKKVLITELGDISIAAGHLTNLSWILE